MDVLSIQNYKPRAEADASRCVVCNATGNTLLRRFLCVSYPQLTPVTNSGKVDPVRKTPTVTCVGRVVLLPPIFSLYFRRRIPSNCGRSRGLNACVSESESKSQSTMGDDGDSTLQTSGRSSRHQLV